MQCFFLIKSIYILKYDEYSGIKEANGSDLSVFSISARLIFHVNVCFSENVLIYKDSLNFCFTFFVIFTMGANPNFNSLVSFFSISLKFQSTSINFLGIQCRILINLFWSFPFLFSPFCRHLVLCFCWFTQLKIKGQILSQMILVKWCPYTDKTENALTRRQKSVSICKISWLEETKTKVNKQKLSCPPNPNQISLMGFRTSRVSKAVFENCNMKRSRCSKLEYEESMWSNRHLG